MALVHFWIPAKPLKLDLPSLSPQAPARPRKLEMHGKVRIDPFHWMRRAHKTTLIDYLQAENAYAAAAMALSSLCVVGNSLRLLGYKRG